ncbi:TetR/AcrR family transcriptional regulator [Actinomycetospora endophytica]|uniref:TetR/AcrR family transcriptional regulator n=1 Tax=Actinomycetospora endophytica TaxID=2291215 RepID=A0ABS8P1S4_9PSEU|nr:TetR/AcrR family transcriptional regulator [Actinomycetospora endophytica]MCD2192205.1 TetR/AcrR family transcriptional regulator [Actinomycetospora endophytica]
MARTPAPGTRERILGVASRLFYDHGVRAVGMNRIITEAGTGKNLLYQHFPAKSDLVAAYLEGARERRAEAARRVLEDAGDDPREQLVAMVAEVATTVRHPRFRGCAFRNYLAEFPEDSGEPGSDDGTAPAAVAHAQLAETRAAIAERVARLDVADPDRLVEQLWLIVDGLYLQAAYRDRLDDRLDPAADAAVDLARRLVGA